MRAGLVAFGAIDGMASDRWAVLMGLRTVNLHGGCAVTVRWTCGKTGGDMRWSVLATIDGSAFFRPTPARHRDSCASAQSAQHWSCRAGDA